MITTAVSIWNMTRLNISPKIIYILLIGVAKNLFNTRVLRRLKNIKATPNTPEANNENPKLAGKNKINGPVLPDLRDISFIIEIKAGIYRAAFINIDCSIY